MGLSLWDAVSPPPSHRYPAGARCPTWQPAPRPLPPGQCRCQGDRGRPRTPGLAGPGRGRALLLLAPLALRPGVKPRPASADSPRACPSQSENFQAWASEGPDSCPAQPHTAASQVGHLSPPDLRVSASRLKMEIFPTAARPRGSSPRPAGEQAVPPGAWGCCRPPRPLAAGPCTLLTLVLSLGGKRTLRSQELVPSRRVYCGLR